MQNPRNFLEAADREFNAREIDAVLARMTADVTWPNGMDGGYVYGREGVREYWTRQWSVVDPQVDPVNITPAADGRFVVNVRQVVRDLTGKLLIDTTVVHVYRLRDGLIERMEIE